MTNTVKGECLCGTVKYEVEKRFKGFYLCHCKQCQRLTGSAFASNIFTDPDNIQWLEGEDRIGHFEHESREFSSAFCLSCGSGLPFINKRGTSLVIPAGSLNEKPDVLPQANIFNQEKACWFAESKDADVFEGFPAE